MILEKCLNKINITQWAFYDHDESGIYSIRLVNKSGEPLPSSFGPLIYPQEVWLFFENPVDIVAVEINADWSEVVQGGSVVSGGEMYAFQNYNISDLPQTRGSFLQWDERPVFCAKTTTKIPINSTHSLVLNRSGITAVMITPWEGGDQDNSIKIDGVYVATME